MSKEAQERISKFTAADKRKKRSKANKKAIKKLDKRSKLSPKQQVKKAHDKIEGHLDKLSKKYGVSIKLNRNKKKMPSVIVSGLKKLSYGDSAKLFSEIPHSSPVPQKMNSNSALFRVFTKRKMTASTSKFVVTASRGGKRLYWTDEGFKEVKASEASHLGEELADKIERRANAKGWQAKTVPAQMTASSVVPNLPSKIENIMKNLGGEKFSKLNFIRNFTYDNDKVRFSISGTKALGNDEFRIIITNKDSVYRVYKEEVSDNEVSGGGSTNVKPEKLLSYLETVTNNKWYNSKVTASTPDDAQTYTLKVNDGDGSLWDLLQFLSKCGSDGHSVSFTIDDQSFGFDGDGADKIYDLSKGNSVEADDGSTDNSSDSSSNNADNSSDSDDSDSDNGDSDDDEETDEQADANKADIVKFINSNGLKRDDLVPLTKQAAQAYSDDLVANAPVEDMVDIIYDMLGQDATRNGIKALVNKKSM